MADFSPLEHLKPHLLLIFGVFLAAGTNVWSATYQESSIKPPAPVRELRAVWVATVANIDWPSRKGLSTAEQKAELLAIVDRAAQLKLNAIVFQVRPACDALYASEIEPWSEFLTGTMGKAPEPYYDPLAYVIDEAHKRGIELHACSTRIELAILRPNPLSLPGMSPEPTRNWSDITASRYGSIPARKRFRNIP